MRIAEIIKSIAVTGGSVLGLAISIGLPTAASSAEVEKLNLPEGFKVTVFAAELRGARMLKVTNEGDLLLSLPRSGQIVWLAADRNNDGVSDERRVLLEKLSRPHGLDIRDGWLYVGEADAIGRVRLDKSQSHTDGEYERIVTGLTGNGNHWTKTVRIGADGYLYVSQGSTCNVCIEDDPRRATIMRFKPNGSDGQIIATGLRNSVGLDWAPWDNALYATENGRDLIGDDVPPEELNKIVPGSFYGWPLVHGFGIVDPQFGKDQEGRIATAVAPAHGFRAHNAPLGLRFLRHPAKGYERSALVALHGSWNRSKPDGYKVVSLHWDKDGKIEERDFVTGFLTDKGPIGRPVDVAEDAAGVIYVSDDLSGAVYRITRQQ